MNLTTTRRRLLAVSLAVFAALLIACGASGKSPTPVAPEVASAAASGVASTKAPAGPKTTIGDGIHEVGVDIVAGKYSTTVPSDSPGCYYARLKNLSGEMTGIITNEIIKAGAKTTVTIAATDKGFESRGCGTWVKAA